MITANSPVTPDNACFFANLPMSVKAGYDHIMSPNMAWPFCSIHGVGPPSQYMFQGPKQNF